MIGIQTLKRSMWKIIRVVVDRLSEETLQALIVRVVSHKTKNIAPDAGLRLIFGLEQALYPLVGNLAVAYGNGIHTKHRHTRYHDFFVNRIEPDERVLDIGCGVGALAYDIAEKSGAYVTGIDLDTKNIAQANERFSHSRTAYEVRDARIEPPGGDFDVIVLSNVLEHLENRSDFLKTVMERVKPKRLLLRVPLFERDWRVPLKKELGLDYRLDPTHYIEYTLESFALEIQAADLRTIHQEVRWGEIWAEVVKRGVNEE